MQVSTFYIRAVVVILMIVGNLSLVLYLVLWLSWGWTRWFPPQQDDSTGAQTEHVEERRHPMHRQNRIPAGNQLQVGT